MGPRGDGTPPRTSDRVDYAFYGQHEFRRRCEAFFQSMDEALANHAAWRHASEATLARARDGIEKYAKVAPLNTVLEGSVLNSL